MNKPTSKTTTTKPAKKATTKPFSKMNRAEKEEREATQRLAHLMKARKAAKAKARAAAGLPSEGRIYDATTLSEMKDLARDHGIAGVSKYKKADLEILRDLILASVQYNSAKNKPAKKATTKPAKKATTKPAKKAAKKTRSTLNKRIHATPGAYLAEAARLLLPLFKKAGYPAPTKRDGTPDFTVGLGFPSKKALATKNRRIGEAWPKATVSTGKAAIIISQAIDVETEIDRIQLLGLLIHEMIHVVMPPGTGHGPAFRRCAIALGLAGKPTATYVETDKAKPGLSGLRDYLTPIANQLGRAPWGTIDGSNVKKQNTRMLKCKCMDCGFLFRATAKWVWGSEETGPRDGSLQCPDPSCSGQIERDGEGF
jgi:hypothetical protein